MKALYERGVRPARAQYGALPWRRSQGLEIMLVSTRGTRRWILPKGWPMKGRKPHAAAAREALEEAGIVGKVGKEPIGVYRYIKRGKNGATLPCEVTIFPLEVATERKNWLEKKERIRRWFSVPDAAQAVQESGLSEIIREFGANETEIETNGSAVLQT